MLNQAAVAAVTAVAVDVESKKKAQQKENITPTDKAAASGFHYSSNSNVKSSECDGCQKGRIPKLLFDHNNCSTEVRNLFIMLKHHILRRERLPEWLEDGLLRSNSRRRSRSSSGGRSSQNVHTQHCSSAQQCSCSKNMFKKFGTK